MVKYTTTDSKLIQRQVLNLRYNTDQPSKSDKPKPIRTM